MTVIRSSRWAVALAGLCLLAPACTSTAPPQSANAASQSAAAGSPIAGPQPLKLADCQTPPVQLPPVSNSIRPDLTIQQPPIECGKPFTAYVDFTYLGDTPGCINAAGTPQSRPCSLPLRTQPYLGAATYQGYAPIEPASGANRARALVKVTCQVVANLGDPTAGEGTLQNDRHERSNIWDQVVVTGHPDEVVWATDLWLGNIGWRKMPCSA